MSNKNGKGIGEFYFDRLRKYMDCRVIINMSILQELFMLITDFTQIELSKLMSVSMKIN